MKKGFGMELGIALVIGIVSLVIVDQVIAARTGTWNSSLTTTISPYVVPIGMLGLLALAAVGYAGSR